MAYTPQATLITGNVAGRQFENSDSAYLTAVYTMSIFNTVNVLLTLALLGVLALIWFKPVRDLIKQITTQVAVLFATTGALLAGTTDSKAFFDKTDKTEAYTILPNQSAFWIPDVGANLANQAQMDSEALYNANRVQLKRFVVPHQKLQGSAGNSMFSGWDYYVPAGRLIIVDRTIGRLTRVNGSMPVIVVRRTGKRDFLVRVKKVSISGSAYRSAYRWPKRTRPNTSTVSASSPRRVIRHRVMSFSFPSITAEA
jgi:hypothetical protein